MIACNNAKHLVEVEPQKNLGGPNLGQNRPQSGSKLGFQPFSQVSFISFP